MRELVNKIRRKLMHLRLQPIRVYCLHHVCAEFDAESMNVGDWTQIDELKDKVQAMQQSGVEFISLSKAYSHIDHDIFRTRQYAVLTFDDGYASLKEVLPWLQEQHIPATMFINGKYLDGKSYRKNPKEQYLTKDELFALVSPLIEIGSHGWEHKDATTMTLEDFKNSEAKNTDLLSMHPRYTPFYAYTYGRHSSEQDVYLLSIGQVPVLVDGMNNYKEKRYIHRHVL